MYKNFYGLFALPFQLPAGFFRKPGVSAGDGLSIYALYHAEGFIIINGIAKEGLAKGGIAAAHH